MGRFLKKHLGGPLQYRKSRIPAHGLLLGSILQWAFEFFGEGAGDYSLSLGFGAFAISLYLISGFQELIEKEYIKKDSNKSSDPT